MVVWEQATRIDLEKDEMFSRSYWKIGIIGRITIWKFVFAGSFTGSIVCRGVSTRGNT